MIFNSQTALEGSIDVENKKENFDKESSICEIVKNSGRNRLKTFEETEGTRTSSFFVK